MTGEYRIQIVISMLCNILYSLPNHSDCNFSFSTGSYNNFFRMFERSGRKEVTFEASREIAKPKTMLKPRKVSFYPT